MFANKGQKFSNFSSSKKQWYFFQISALACKEQSPFILWRQLRESSFFQNCGTFNTNQNKKYHNFNRNKISTTVFLKWLDFISPIKKIEAIYSIRDFFFCVSSEIFWPLKVTTKYWVMVGFSDSIDLFSGKQGKTSK